MWTVKKGRPCARHRKNKSNEDELKRSSLNTISKVNKQCDAYLFVQKCLADGFVRPRDWRRRSRRIAGHSDCVCTFILAEFSLRTAIEAFGVPRAREGP